MADLPGEGYVDRYSDALKVLLGARSGEPIHELAPELVACITLEDANAEFMAPLGVRAWTSGIVSQIGDATHIAEIEVINPAGSNFFTVVTGASVSGPQASTSYDLILDGTAAGGALIVPVFRDTRLTGKPATQLSSGKPDTAIGAQQVVEQQSTGTTLVGNINFVTLPYVLFPGHRIKLEPAVVNLTLTAQLWGYERQLVPGEDKTR
jgi:hypothetical protein